MDIFFSKTFNASKCKAYLRLTISRVKVLRNKRSNQVRLKHKEIAGLLTLRKENKACAQIEQFIREQYMMEAYDIIKIYCGVLISQLPVIEKQRECPDDVKESVTTIVFAAAKCSDLPELLHVRDMFTAKYGKKFVAASTDLQPGCRVDKTVSEKLASHSVNAELILKSLKKIAQEYGIEWDSSDLESYLHGKHDFFVDGRKSGSIKNNAIVYSDETNESHFTPIELPHAPVSIQESNSESVSSLASTQKSCSSSSLKERRKRNSSKLQCDKVLQMKPILFIPPYLHLVSPNTSPSNSSKSMHEMQQCSLLLCPESTHSWKGFKDESNEISLENERIDRTLCATSVSAVCQDDVGTVGNETTLASSIPTELLLKSSRLTENASLPCIQKNENQCYLKDGNSYLNENTDLELDSHSYFIMENGCQINRNKESTDAIGTVDVSDIKTRTQSSGNTCDICQSSKEERPPLLSDHFEDIDVSLFYNPNIFHSLTRIANSNR